MSKKALLVIDVQNDFCEGGALAVADADSIVSTINKLVADQMQFDLIIASQDFHPENHGSFASNHDVEVFSMGELNGEPQVMWPDHCVQGTHGVQFHDDLDMHMFDVIVQKGVDAKVDSYSAFKDNGGLNDSGLATLLRDENIEEVYVTGLATDYCVKFTALDAIAEGFKTFMVTDAMKGVNQNPSDSDEAIMHVLKEGGYQVNSVDLLKVLE
jgi:nicotinamidase/pyrazinamidase